MYSPVGAIMNIGSIAVSLLAFFLATLVVRYRSFGTYQSVTGKGFDEMKKFKIIIISVVAVILGLCSVAALFYFGVLHINNPSKKRYPVVGVDVSAYQGEIDWEVLSKQKIDFAYIKATEGSSHVDACFSYNWENASRTNLRIGAYHFFSFESAGETQAKNFIDTVSPVDHMLPPVIDVEYYGRFGSSDNISVPDVISELRSLVDELTDAYGMKPVIYVSEETFNSIVDGNFDDCDIWYRSVYAKVPKDAEWKFWQFSNRHHVKGYNGTERYIDFNVFNGTKEDFAGYPLH
jgi:Lyzozyme M1 (1,4-beta-N-acetylmuramidase)